MSAPTTDAEAPTRSGRPVRPTGTWVVAGFLLLATVSIWLIVTIIFQARS